MRKDNFITLLVFAVMIIGVVIYASLSANRKDDNNNNDNDNETASDSFKFEESISTVSHSQSSEKEDDTVQDFTLPVEETTEEESTSDIETSAETDDKKDVDPADLSDALFIGDSRTVGIMEYAGLNEADFFCTTGMSVFSIHKDRISVSGVGKVTLNELLSSKKYGKIYVMLGINELGYPFKNVVNKYNELYDFIREYQPDAAVFIQANLHVTEKRSESDKYINNTAINKLNTELKKLADNPNTFYLDVNPLFDDDGGNLSADKSSDNAHLYAKHYLEWGEWLRIETAKLM